MANAAADMPASLDLYDDHQNLVRTADASTNVGVSGRQVRRLPSAIRLARPIRCWRQRVPRLWARVNPPAHPIHWGRRDWYPRWVPKLHSDCSTV
ncbi:MAG TPA: hypothetical protein VMJ75_10120 [Candidatus Acidoferrales bacterium]|nr:hypothetical protein [Candidatus Acidoferrales bacterium]